ncbi:hypothetical protein C2845_PM11G00800 [Panicum miliaceum]|uniref:Uncharacterized protein n=1 Tax=Panicum miliaceum TaxID=4540 RepID=A0A3L6RP60_PANMI|nr:hypothetical protein C2845_PM11G00800 [Panicum miliaceum]
MEAAAAASSSSSSSLSALLRHRLRATVRRCFGNGVGLGLGLGERMRWRRRAGAGEFRYDALNFDGGDLADVDGEEDRFRRGRVLRRTFSSQLTPAPRAAVEAA